MIGVLYQIVVVVGSGASASVSVCPLVSSWLLGIFLNIALICRGTTKFFERQSLAEWPGLPHVRLGALVTSLTPRVLPSASVSGVQFRRPTIVGVTVFLVGTSFSLLVSGRRSKGGFCPSKGLIKSLFHISLIQLVVEMDGYFDEVGHIDDASAVTHNLVLHWHHHTR